MAARETRDPPGLRRDIRQTKESIPRVLRMVRKSARLRRDRSWPDRQAWDGVVEDRCLTIATFLDTERGSPINRCSRTRDSPRLRGPSWEDSACTLLIRSHGPMQQSEHSGLASGQ